MIDINNIYNNSNTMKNMITIFFSYYAKNMYI